VVYKQLQVIFKCSGYKAPRHYLFYDHLIGGLATSKIIHLCTFLDWVQRHTKRVWPSRGSSLARSSAAEKHMAPRLSEPFRLWKRSKAVRLGLYPPKFDQDEQDFVAISGQ